MSKMGFSKRRGIYHLKCDLCSKTASGSEFKLTEEGWSWGKMDITINGERKQINYAGCPDHDGSKKALGMLKELETEMEGKE